jgi:hypothetical protein
MPLFDTSSDVFPQGIMFGYASDETKELMPLTHSLATKIGLRLTEVRNKGILNWVRPDGKTQVTVAYKKVNGRMVPQRVHTIVISTQHNPDVTNEKIHADLMEQVIKPVRVETCASIPSASCFLAGLQSEHFVSSSVSSSFTRSVFSCRVGRGREVPRQGHQVLPQPVWPLHHWWPER